jgi:iron(III) transport system permease protein
MTAGPLTVRPPAEVRRTRSRGWWTATALVLLPALIPPLSLAWQVIIGGTGTGLPLGRLWELFAGTVALTAAVTVTALAIGTLTAWLTTRTDIPGRRFWMIVAALPLVIPSYMAALTIIGATGPGGVLSAWFGLEIPTPYGFVGAWLALSIFLAPMAHLIVTPALRLIDPAIEEAAVGLGAGGRRVFFTITLPQLRPALVSAGLMIGLYTISDFGAVSLLRFDTFTRAIFTLYSVQIDRRPVRAPHAYACDLPERSAASGPRADPAARMDPGRVIRLPGRIRGNRSRAAPFGPCLLASSRHRVRTEPGWDRR